MISEALAIPPTTDTPAPEESDALQATVAPQKKGDTLRRKNERNGERASDRTDAVQPVLEKLFSLYPKLFGAEFFPLKLGVYQELLAAHPDDFQRDTLKAALGVHTRSARYLQSVAAGKKRHDLQGIAGDDVAPEHIYLALLELYRRRQGRTAQDLGPILRAQLLAAFEASGLERAEYLARVQPKGGDIHPALIDTLAELDQKLAKQEALRRAFEASGKTPEAFAEMYGLNVGDIAPILSAA